MIAPEKMLDGDESANPSEPNPTADDPFVGQPERGAPNIDEEGGERPEARQEMQHRAAERAARLAALADDEDTAVDTPDPQLRLRIQNAQQFARREADHIHEFHGVACVGSVAAAALDAAYVHLGRGEYVRVPLDRSAREIALEGRVVHVDADGHISPEPEQIRGVERDRGRIRG